MTIYVGLYLYNNVEDTETVSIPMFVNEQVNGCPLKLKEENEQQNNLDTISDESEDGSSAGNDSQTSTEARPIRRGRKINKPLPAKARPVPAVSITNVYLKQQQAADESFTEILSLKSKQ